MTFAQALAKLTRDQLAAWCEDHDLAIPDGITTKGDLLEFVLDSSVAELEAYRAATLDAIAEQCRARRLLDEDGGVVADGVLKHIADTFGKPIEDMDMPELTRLNRGIADVMLGALGGRKRAPLQRRPASLQV